VRSHCRVCLFSCLIYLKNAGRDEILPPSRRCKSAARHHHVASSKNNFESENECERRECEQGMRPQPSSLRDLILKHTLAGSPQNLFSQINYSQRFWACATLPCSLWWTALSNNSVFELRGPVFAPAYVGRCVSSKRVDDGSKKRSFRKKSLSVGKEN
jgi:hypothetical protein